MMKYNDNVWTGWCLRTGGVEHIYGECQAPSLYGVELQSLTFNFGEDTNAQLAFITKDVPRPMPEKWETAGVNAVRIVLDLIDIRVDNFNMHDACMMTGSIVIAGSGGDYIGVRVSDRQGRTVINLVARYIAVNSLSGTTVCGG